MDLISDRRALHRIPELDRNLPETLDYLRSALEPLPCKVFSPAESALCAFFDFGRDHSLAFRADMDALPVSEATGLPFASCHPGKMHACGHDGHMAIALELARRLVHRGMAGCAIKNHYFDTAVRAKLLQEQFPQEHREI